MPRRRRRPAQSPAAPPSARIEYLLSLIEDAIPMPTDGIAFIEQQLTKILALRWAILRCYLEDGDLAAADQLSNDLMNFSSLKRTRVDVTTVAQDREEIDRLSREFERVPLEDLERMLTGPTTRAEGPNA